MSWSPIVRVLLFVPVVSALSCTDEVSTVIQVEMLFPEGTE